MKPGKTHHHHRRPQRPLQPPNKPADAVSDVIHRRAPYYFHPPWLRHFCWRQPPARKSDTKRPPVPPAVPSREEEAAATVAADPVVPVDTAVDNTEAVVVVDTAAVTDCHDNSDTADAAAAAVIEEAATAVATTVDAVETATAAVTDCHEEDCSDSDDSANLRRRHHHPQDADTHLSSPVVLLKTCSVNFFVPLNIFVLFREVVIGASAERLFYITPTDANAEEQRWMMSAGLIPASGETRERYSYVLSLSVLGARYRNQIRGSGVRALKASATKKRVDFSNQCSVTARWSLRPYDGGSAAEVAVAKKSNPKDRNGDPRADDDDPAACLARGRTVVHRRGGGSPSCDGGSGGGGVRPAASGLVNFKVFNNSKIIVTGMKEPNALVSVVARLFMDLIADLEYVVEADGAADRSWLDDVMLFFNDGSLETFASFNYSHFEELLTLQELTGIDIPDELKQFSYADFFVDPSQAALPPLRVLIEKVTAAHPELPLRRYFTTVMICYTYGSRCMLDHCSGPLREIIRARRPFPVLLHDRTDDNGGAPPLSFSLSVENINAIVHFDYVLDRARFAQLIRSSDIPFAPGVATVSYDPALYQGVNLKAADGTTFLVFQEGKVLISGARTESQLTAAAEAIGAVIRTYRADLAVAVRPQPASAAYALLRIPRNAYVLARLRFVPDTAQTRVD